MRLKYSNPELVNMASKGIHFGREGYIFSSDSMSICHMNNLRSPTSPYANPGNHQSRWEYLIMADMLPGWVLFSYNTPIAIISDKGRKLYVTPEKYSVTTARHVKLAKKLKYEYKQQSLCSTYYRGGDIVSAVLESTNLLELAKCIESSNIPIKVRCSRRMGFGKLWIELKGKGEVYLKFDAKSKVVREYEAKGVFFPQTSTKPWLLIYGAFLMLGCHKGICENVGEKGDRYLIGL